MGEASPGDPRYTVMKNSAAFCPCPGLKVTAGEPRGGGRRDALGGLRLLAVPVRLTGRTRNNHQGRKV